MDNNNLNELYFGEDSEDEFLGFTEDDLVAEEGDEAGADEEEGAEDGPVWEDGDREPELHQFISRTGINVELPESPVVLDFVNLFISE